MCDKGPISDISNIVGAAIEQTSKQDRAGMGISAPKSRTECAVFGTGP